MKLSARNIGLCPVRPAEISPLLGRLSRFQTRWAHRLQVYVPTHANRSKMYHKSMLQCTRAV